MEGHVSAPQGPEPLDVELVERARAGERDAFASLYRRHQALVYRFALGMTGSTATAEDVVHDVFLALMTKLHKYDADRAALPSYLVGMARNIARNKARAFRRLISIEHAGDAAGPDDTAAALTSSDDARVLRACILALPLRYREVVLLCDLQEMPYTDVAVALRVPVGTVRSRLHRARQMLMERLRRREGGASRVPEAERCVS
jgi:RNA polymerase sigma-70 factor (ECF subfamily)